MFHGLVDTQSACKRQTLTSHNAIFHSRAAKDDKTCLLLPKKSFKTNRKQMFVFMLYTLSSANLFTFLYNFPILNIRVEPSPKKQTKGLGNFLFYCDVTMTSKITNQKSQCSIIKKLRTCPYCLRKEALNVYSLAKSLQCSHNTI